MNPTQHAIDAARAAVAAISAKLTTEEYMALVRAVAAAIERERNREE